MVEVALVRVNFSSDSWGDTSLIANSISDWEEVSGKDLEVLRRFSRDSIDYDNQTKIIIVEKLDKEEVKLSVSRQLEIERKRIDDHHARKEKDRLAKIKRDEKKKERDLAKALRVIQDAKLNPEEYRIMHEDKEQE